MKSETSHHNTPNFLSWILAVTCVFYLNSTAFSQNPPPISNHALDDKLLENFSLLSEVLAHIQQGHLDPPDPQQLMYGAIRGMLRTLDPYTQFFDPDNYEDFRTESRGAYGGLGMAIGIRQDRLTVISPFKGTPAYVAGIETGDIINQIEDQSTLTMTVDEAVEKLRGEPGTQVTITLVREGETEPLEITLTRDVIRFESVESRILKGNTGYLRINQFRDTTAVDVDRAFEFFDSHDLRGLILDVRSNPGGLLKSAVDVASDFLKPGQLIVYTRSKGSREDFISPIAQQQKYYPLIVLVNSGSASGSEIVAAAIKDQGRGLVLGEKTFGKASVQKVVPLSSGAAVKLTIAHYYSPAGIDINRIGIVPDIEVPWFSRSENRILTKLRHHETIQSFIEDNGDDVLARLDAARHASNENEEARVLLKKYTRVVDSLSREGLVISNSGLDLAIARETENELDEYENDPQILAAIHQLKVLELFATIFSKSTD